MLPICRVSNTHGENVYTKTLTHFRIYKSRRLNLSNGNYHQRWCVCGLVRMVVMKVHISLQAIRRELNTGLEEEPKRIQ